ncbi:MAG: DUF3877 family protein [Coriobacteriales bacterium]
MDAQRLEKDIIDQIVELQVKLGYAYESTRFYYKTESLNAMLGTSAPDAGSLCALLQRERALEGSPLGDVSFGTHEDRIEVRIPPAGSLYVHEQVPAPAFLADLIELFLTKHHPSKEEVMGLFAKHSASYAVDEMPPGSEFDYAVHFEDPGIDPHYYCFKEEMGHLVYHRFAREDYEQLLA